jgi:hypothetical protein
MRLSFPRWQGGFHLFCHTYGTWLYLRYRHGDVSEESQRADWLPVERQVRRQAE